jgi:hypothetical protein
MKRDYRHTGKDSKLHIYNWTETDQNKIFPKTLVSIIMPNFTQIR